MVSSSVNGFPVAAIIVLGLIAYFIIVVMFIFLYFKNAQNNAQSDVEGLHEQNVPSLCISMGESCGCPYPSMRRVLKSCCPTHKLSCEAILLCQCFRQDSPVPASRPGFCSCLSYGWNCTSLNCVCCDVNMPAPSERRNQQLTTA